ncbi:MAG: LysM peptidoglycan-binding domain-containing protein [Clostridia bacterium]|nr:LysM peptidoglycan-binding domain-containing protein [Clostridia bacterium]
MSNKDKQFFKKAIAIFVLFVVLIATIHWLNAPEVEAWELHTVQYGDKLWDIAKEHNPGYEGDLRDIMHCIKKANSMEDSTVYVGHVLAVPVMGT